MQSCSAVDKIDIIVNPVSFGVHRVKSFRLLLWCGLLFVVTRGSVDSYNRTYGRYTYILPLQSFTVDKSHVTYSPLRNDFSTAQQFCAMSFTGSKLATIKSEASQKNINNFIERAKQEMGNLYIEYVRVGGESYFQWRWVNGKILKSQTVEGSSNAAVAAHALLVATANTFRQKDHNAAKYYICQYSKASFTGDCAFNESGRCFDVKSRNAVWMEARSDCISEGGDLASFDNFNDTMFTALVQKLSLGRNYEYWVGLRKEAVWHWDNPAYEMNYTNWRFDQSSANGQCLALHFPVDDYKEKGKWTASNCSVRLPFICELYDEDEPTTTEPLSSLQNSCQVSTVALSIFLAIFVIVSISLAIIFITKRSISRTTCSQIRDNEFSSSTETSQGKAKQTSGSNTCESNGKEIYANYTQCDNSAKLSINAPSGSQPTTKNSHGNNEPQQSSIYVSVQTRGGNSASLVREDESSSAAAADAGKLIYAEVEFSRPPTK